MLRVWRGGSLKVCRQELERYLEAEGKTLLAIPLRQPDELKHLAGQLLELPTPPGTGAVWVAAAVSEGTREYEPWLAAWREGAARLNQFRNLLRRQLEVPLVFVGAPWLQEVLRGMSPDLWSVRTLVARIEPAPPAERELADATLAYGGEPTVHPNFGAFIASVTELFREESQPDPEYALERAARLRGKPGQELQLAALLHRAGLGFIARYDWSRAAEALSEAVELRTRFQAEAASLEESLYYLARALIWQNDYKQARLYLERALSLYQQVGNRAGEAAAWHQLATIDVNEGSYGAAREKFRRALLLYQAVGNRWGEAHAYHNLGKVAFLEGRNIESQEIYRRALLLYQAVRDKLGEAHCYQRLGDVALVRSDHTTARQEYEAALALYEQIEEPYSIGLAHQRLARLVSEETERSRHVQAARAAWERIDRSDLVQELEREFGAVGEP